PGRPSGLIRCLVEGQPNLGAKEARGPADHIAISHGNADSRILTAVGVERPFALKQPGEPDQLAVVGDVVHSRSLSLKVNSRSRQVLCSRLRQLGLARCSGGGVLVGPNGAVSPI